MNGKLVAKISQHQILRELTFCVVRAGLAMRSAIIFLALVVTTPSLCNAQGFHINKETPLGPQGMGPIRIGMTFSQAKNLVSNTLYDPWAYLGTRNPAECTFTSFRGEPQGVSLMLINGVIQRFVIDDRATNRTPEGIGIGSSERDVLSAYRLNKIRIAERSAVSREIVVTVRNPPYSMYTFGTDTKKVSSIWIGVGDASCD
ncbi:MAG: hypothetical protein GC190_07420 [Alphaproteobacteria bacterium]|nr:hypothetical protein [Alphaproteobacteria bacterium]